MQSSEPIIPILTFSYNPNNYYTSTNDTTTMFVNNVQMGNMLIFQTTSLLLIVNLLIFMPIFGKLSVKISANLKLFLSFHAIFIATLMVTYLQKAFALFDPRVNFYTVVWIGIITGPYNFIQPYLSMILTVERILIIQFPITFTHYRKHYICGAAILTILVYCFTLMWYILEQPLDKDAALCSPPLIGTSPKFGYIPQSSLKMFFGGLDLFCSALFFYCLNKNKEMGKNIKNRVVKFTVICEILLEVLPAFIYQFSNFTKILPKFWALFVGNFCNLLATMNMTLCVLYYNWIFLFVAPRQIAGASSSQGKLVIVRKAGQKY